MSNTNPATKSGPMKKVLIGLGAFFGLIALTLLVIPFFVKIDQFRPQIQEAVNKKLQGRVELGELSLSLIPNVRVSVDGVRALAPAPYATEPLATVEKIRIEMPLWSLVTAPRATFRVVKPSFALIQDKAGGNLKAFLPVPPTEPATSPPAQGAPAQGESAPTAPGDASPAAIGEALQALPAWISSRVLAARMSVVVEDAAANIRQEGMAENDKILVNDFDLGFEGIGLRTPIEMSYSLRPDVAMAGATISGEIKAKGTLTVDLQGSDPKLLVAVDQDYSGLDIRYRNLFHKPAGTTLGLSVTAQVEQGAKTQIELSPLEFRFDKLKFSTRASLRDVGTDEGAVRAELKMDDVDLSGFGAFVPLVRSYELDGSVALVGQIEGSLKDPRFDINLLVKEGRGATPELKQPVTDLSGKIRLFGTAKEPQLKIEPLSMKIGESDLSVRLATKGIERPQVELGLESRLLNLDQLIGLKSVVVGVTEGAATTTGQGQPAPKASPVASTQPLDESLAQMAPTLEAQLKNPMLDKVTAKIATRIGTIRALGADFTQASFNMTLANRKLVVDRTGLGGYGGRLTVASQLDLRPEALGVNFSSDLQGVRIHEMTRLHAPAWQKELSGSLTGQMTLALKGLRREQLQEHLRGSLRGEILNGQLSLPLMKVLGIVLASVPPVAGRKIETPKTDREFRGDFKTARIVSSIEGRRIKLEDLNVTYDTLDRRVGDVKFTASGTVSFERQLEILGTAFLSPEVIRIGELKGASGQVEIPLKLSGDMSDPKPDIGYTVRLLTERVAKGLLASQQEALKAKLEEERRRVQAQIDAERQKTEARVAEEKAKAEAEARRKVEEQAKKAAEDLKKKFKF